MRALLGAIAASLLAACTTYDRYYSDAAYYDAYSVAHEASYVYGAYDLFGVYYGSESGPQPVDLDVAAAAIAARAGDWFLRGDCLKATSAGPAITLELDHCEPVFGAKDLEGRVGIVLSQGEGEQLRFAVSSSNFRIDDDDFILSFTGLASSNGTQRVVTFDSKSRRPDKADSRSSTGTITWQQGSGCVTIDAQSRSTKDDVSVNTTLAGFQQCAGRCPSAGEVRVEGGEGVFSGAFNGSDRLRVFAPNGGDRSYGLQCR